MDNNIDNIFPNTYLSTAINITPNTSYTVPSYGWLRLTYTNGAMSTAHLMINDIVMVITDWRNEWNAGNAYLSWPLKPNDRVSSQGFNAAYSIVFFPISFS